MNPGAKLRTASQIDRDAEI
jgi:hypothetical protein